jgi:hypothetical protein
MNAASAKLSGPSLGTGCGQEYDTESGLPSSHGLGKRTRDE